MFVNTTESLCTQTDRCTSKFYVVSTCGSATWDLDCTSEGSRSGERGWLPQLIGTQCSSLLGEWLMHLIIRPQKEKNIIHYSHIHGTWDYSFHHNDYFLLSWGQKIDQPTGEWRFLEGVAQLSSPCEVYNKEFWYVTLYLEGLVDVVVFNWLKSMVENNS